MKRREQDRGIVQRIKAWDRGEEQEQKPIRGERNEWLKIQGSGLGYAILTVMAGERMNMNSSWSG